MDSAGENLPNAQGEHSVAPMLLKLPAPQLVQWTALPVENVPGPHTIQLSAANASPVCDPAPQALHDDAAAPL